MLLFFVPLKIILWQLLFLSLNISIESFVWQRVLFVTPQISVTAATITNLLNAIMNWLIFFSAFPSIPPNKQILIIEGIISNNISKAILFDLFASLFLIIGLNCLLKGLITKPLLQYLRLNTRPIPAPNSTGTPGNNEVNNQAAPNIPISTKMYLQATFLGYILSLIIFGILVVIINK